MRKKLILSIIVASMLIALLAACKSIPTPPAPAKPDPAPIVEIEARSDDACPSPPPIIEIDDSATLSSLPMPVASGTSVKKNAHAEIDYSNVEDGYIMIKYLQKTSKELRVIIKGPSTVNYTYRLNPNGEYEAYPLTDGNGNYTITVYEQIEETRYRTVNSVTVRVALDDEFAPFLRPSQYVNYDADSTIIQAAAKITANAVTDAERVAAIHDFVVERFTYDRQRAEDVESGYLPDLDDVWDKKEGICFDYAALTVAMLRSQGIPAQLAVGYAGQDYHAWVYVFHEDTWTRMDPTFESTAHRDPAAMRYIGSGTDYTVKFIY